MAIGFSTTASFGNRTVVPDRGMGRSNTPIIFQAKFGDGYEQRSTFGLNSIWSLSKPAGTYIIPSRTSGLVYILVLHFGQNLTWRLSPLPPE